MGKLLMALLAVALVQGCESSSSKRIHYQDGSEGHRLECDVLDTCYDKAGAICQGKGFTTVEQSTGARSGSAAKVNVLIRCNK